MPTRKRDTLKINLRYIVSDYDRHIQRIFVRRHGRKIRIREQPGTPEFMQAYREALDTLNEAAGAAQPITGKTTIGTFGWLTARYLASADFKALVLDSQFTRQRILEECLREPMRPDAKEVMAGCPLTVLSARHIKMLRDRKKGLPGAANNRRKYLSTMLGWAVEEGLIKSNPSRDVKKIKNVTSGFHQWSVEEVRKFEAHHAIGMMPRLALALMLYLGVRRGDAVRLGHANVTDGWIKFVPAKTDYMRKTVSEKPILPVLARIIAATASGTKTFLVTSHGKPFAAKGFGNWFRERCDEAGLPQCTAHGLRKAGAAICAEWTSSAQATTYTRGADKRALAGEAARLLEQGMNRGTSSDREQEVSDGVSR